MTKKFNREPSDGRHVREGMGNLLFQSYAFTLELIDSAARFCHDLSQLSFGGFDLAVEEVKVSVVLVKETAGVSKGGRGGWIACKGMEGHDGRTRDRQGEIKKKAWVGLAEASQGQMTLFKFPFPRCGYALKARPCSAFSLHFYHNLQLARRQVTSGSVPRSPTFLFFFFSV